MNENNIKALFPEGIETITISKNDYDRLYGQLTYENIILQSKIDKANKYLDEVGMQFDNETAYRINEYPQWIKLKNILKEDK